MFGSGTIRTGIDLGTGSVKLIRGQGTAWVERITHIGVEPWHPHKDGDDMKSAAAALGRLLDRLRLSRRQLGHIAVAVGDGASVREAALPLLSEDELRRALPFEARKHLFLENMTSPVLDFQILGPAPTSQGSEGPQVRVLLAAVDESVRTFPLKTLEMVGIEPEVVDLEPLAGLNALFRSGKPKIQESQAVALLDIGRHRMALHATRADGPFMSRPIGSGPPESGFSPEFMGHLIGQLQETVTFYRGRTRSEIASLHLCGGGALSPDLPGRLQEALEIPVAVLDPIHDLAMRAEGSAAIQGAGPRFTVALGLSQWWDRPYV